MLVVGKEGSFPSQEPDRLSESSIKDSGAWIRNPGSYWGRIAIDESSREIGVLRSYADHLGIAKDHLEE